MPNRIFNRFTVLLMAAALMAQFGCATLTADATEEQRFFEVKAQWNTALSGAIVFANSSAGQARSEVIRKMQAVAIRVGVVVTDLDIVLCNIGTPTATDPAPPPSVDCVPLSGDAKSRRLAFVSRVLLVAIPEITALFASR